MGVPQWDLLEEAVQYSKFLSTYVKRYALFLNFLKKVITFFFNKLPGLGDNEKTFLLLPPAHLSATHGGGFTLSHFIDERGARKLEY